MNKKKLTSVVIVFAALFFAMGQRSVYADGISVNVSVDTSALPTMPGSEIFFVLTDGSLTGDMNNTAALSTFMFGGGSAGMVDPANIGGVSGDLSGASLTDSAFTNVFGAFFTAGSQLSFLLNLTTNVDPGPTPDQFAFAILDPNGVPISTTDPTGSNNLLVINLDSTNPVPTAYSDLVTVTPTVVTPEPPAGLLVGTALFALALFSLRRSTVPRSLLG
jgi:hypothetical protein